MSEFKLIVSFRTIKLEFFLQEEGPILTALNIKQKIIESEPDSLQLAPTDIKLLFKGKVLENDSSDDLFHVLTTLSKKPQKTYKILATGRSSTEVQEMAEDHEEALKHAPRIRDDLTEKGQREAEKRKRLGRQMLQKAAQKTSPTSSDFSGFGTIETLPNLPNEDKARSILTQLANDPGVLACMKKHNWKVGSLAELYPEGKVGESEVCVMGLNRNKGQQILLRVRTDDLKGFRKILSIRKVLFHELAHNVHSEHDSNFFQLMRQVERECNEMDWTQGSGLSEIGREAEDSYMYSGGTYRLGSGHSSNQHDIQGLSDRELRARAALNRMTAEEVEIEQHCGCNCDEESDKFLPKRSAGERQGKRRQQADSGRDEHH